MSRIINKNSMSTVAFFNILGPIILNGVSFFTIPIFTRVLGTQNYGLYSFYKAWASIMTIIVGLQTSGSIATATVYYNEKEQKEYLSSITTLSLCSFATIFVVSIIFINPISIIIDLNSKIVILMLLQSFFTFCSSIATGYFTFKKDAFKTFFISIITAVSGIALSLLLIYQIKDKNMLYVGRILGDAIPIILIGFVLMINLFINGKVFYSKKYWSFCLPLSIPLIFHSLSHIALSQGDRIMLKNMTTSSSSVGIYSFVYSLASILNIIWNALNNTWLPFYFDYVKNNDNVSIKNKSKNYIQLYTILTMGFILLSPEVAKVCAPQEYWSGIKVIPILATAMYMIFLYSFPVNFEFYYKKTVHIAVGTIMAALLNILLNYFLIPKYEMYGAAIATLISYIVLFVFHQILCIKVIDNNYHYPFKIFIPYCFSVTVSSIMFYVLENLWLPRFGIACLLGIYTLRKIIKNKSII